MNKPNVIFLNHKEKACGVYQYGYRSGNILKKSEKYNFVYIEVSSKEEFVNAINTYNPIGIIYNYTSLTMPWFSEDILVRYSQIIHYGLYHEGPIPGHNLFNYILFVDSTHNDTEKSFSIPRPLFETNFSYSKPEIPVFTSFGFGFEHKGFERIVQLINSQFDKALIRFQISTSFYGDRDGARAMGVINRCKQEIKKPNIHLSITNNFMTDENILELLASSTLNIFLYEMDYFDCGISSVLDYALSVDVPIAIRKSTMFRHMKDAASSICIENKPLQEIINAGIEPLQVFKDRWSHKSFIQKYESFIHKTCL
jgi:hypothetical protein